jgi:hypothetical protein
MALPSRAELLRTKFSEKASGGARTSPELVKPLSQIERTASQIEYRGTHARKQAAATIRSKAPQFRGEGRAMSISEKASYAFGRRNQEREESRKRLSGEAYTGTYKEKKRQVKAYKETLKEKKLHAENMSDLERNRLYQEGRRKALATSTNVVRKQGEGIYFSRVGTAKDIDIHAKRSRELMPGVKSKEWKEQTYERFGMPPPTRKRIKLTKATEFPNIVDRFQIYKDETQKEAGKDRPWYETKHFRQFTGKGL